MKAVKFLLSHYFSAPASDQRGPGERENNFFSLFQLSKTFDNNKEYKSQHYFLF